MITLYGAGKSVSFPAQFAEVEGWFEEWIIDSTNVNRKRDSARKWGAFVLWSAAWKRLPLEIEEAKSKRGEF